MLHANHSAAASDVSDFRSAFNSGMLHTKHVSGGEHAWCEYICMCKSVYVCFAVLSLWDVWVLVCVMFWIYSVFCAGFSMCVMCNLQTRTSSLRSEHAGWPGGRVACRQAGRAAGWPGASAAGRWWGALDNSAQWILIVFRRF